MNKQAYTQSARGHRLLTDYVMFNLNMASRVRVTYVSGGREVHTDHYMVVYIWTRWRKVQNNPEADKKEAFKVYLLHKGHIHQKILTEYAQLAPTINNVEEEWSSVRNRLEKLSNVALGTKRINTRETYLNMEE